MPSIAPVPIFSHRAPPTGYDRNWVANEFAAIQRTNPGIYQATGDGSGTRTAYEKMGEGPNVSPEDFVRDAGTGDTAKDNKAFTLALRELESSGGILKLAATTYLINDQQPPSGVSGAVIGAAGSGSIMKPDPANATRPTWDLQGRNGPAWVFARGKCDGARPGHIETTAFLMGGVDGTNGIRFWDWWVSGCVYAKRFTAVCTDIRSIGCTTEQCSFNHYIESDPTGIMAIGETNFVNACDLRVTGDCRTMLFSGYSYNCTTIAVLADTATNFTLRDYAIQGAAQGIQLTNADGAALVGVSCGGCTTDIDASGTNYLFSDGCAIDYSAVLASGVLVGSRRGLKQRTWSVAAKPTMTNIPFYRGDRAELYQPTAGTVAEWVNAADSVLGVDAGDWRDCAAIS